MLPRLDSSPHPNPFPGPSGISHPVSNRITFPVVFHRLGSAPLFPHSGFHCTCPKIETPFNATLTSIEHVIGRGIFPPHPAGNRYWARSTQHWWGNFPLRIKSPRRQSPRVWEWVCLCCSFLVNSMECCPNICFTFQCIKLNVWLSSLVY